VLVFLVNVIATLRKDEYCEEDPWDARTLEWMTSSPPPEYNFAEIPVVEHRDEWWHRKYTEDDEGRLVKLPPSPASTIPARRDPNEPHNIHMPSPSYWPFVLALGLPIIGYGFVFQYWWLLGIGALVTFFGLNAWTSEPASEEHPALHSGPGLAQIPEAGGQRVEAQ
jgi:cytochrome c oxidase subunit I